MDLLTRDVTQVGRIEPTATEPPFRRRDVGVRVVNGPISHGAVASETGKTESGDNVSPLERSLPRLGEMSIAPYPTTGWQARCSESESWNLVTIGMSTTSRLLCPIRLGHG